MNDKNIIMKKLSRISKDGLTPLITYYDINRENIEKYIIKNQNIISCLSKEVRYTYENVSLYMSEDDFNMINDFLDKKLETNPDDYFLGTHNYFYHEIDTKELVLIHKNNELGEYDLFYDDSNLDNSTKLALLKVKWETTTMINGDRIPCNFCLFLIQDGKEIPIHKFMSYKSFTEHLLKN